MRPEISIQYSRLGTYLKFLAVVFLILQSNALFSAGPKFVDSAFVYYQNYEYLSTVRLNDYNGYYGNVKLLRYSLPNDVLSAIWRLQVISTKSCAPTKFYFYLDYSGYPVLSPHNYTFPRNFNNGRMTQNYVSRTISGKSPLDKQEIFLNVSSPNAGYWYSAAFVEYDDEMVKPSLLRTNCSFYLTASVNLWRLNDTQILYPNKTVTDTKHDIFKIYKYITSSNYDGPVTFKLHFQNNTVSDKCSMTALLRESAFPDMTSFSKNSEHKLCKFNTTNSSSCELTISYPMSNTWNYLAVTSTCNYTVRVDSKIDCFFSHTSLISQPVGLSQINTSSALANTQQNNEICSKLSPPIETFRFIGPTYFSVKYYFNSNYNRSNSVLIQNDQKPYFIEFLVDLSNNGGTLNFKLINNLILDPGYKFTNNNDNQSNTSSKANDFDLNGVKYVLKMCLLFNSMSAYKNCPKGYELETLSHYKRYSNLAMSIPYPMMGKWYLSIWKECYDKVTNELVDCPRGYVPYVVAQLSSDQCANNYCGEHGTCYIINSQLNLVSGCKCSGGYQGYGCTDSSDATSSATFLASVLFLTMSNLVFMLPISLALYRRWYIEALIYFNNMFFSTFYHACDQDYYSFCIFNYDGLQLADFIGSYASFVITVLSMSVIVRPWKVFLFFVGFLMVVSINLYDRFNYTVFIIFLCLAISVTISTWVKVCVSKRKLYPTRRTLLLFYLPGFILALTGIIIYSFLQTKTNYWVLHSIWHMCMASSILFFLPKREYPQIKTMITNESLKDVTTTSSSLSDSTGSNHTDSTNDRAMTQSPISPLHSDHNEVNLLDQVEPQEKDTVNITLTLENS